MASSTATTVDQYLEQLPPDRRAALARLRGVVNTNLPAGFEEGMQYGMISWYIPLARYPHTYNGQPLAIASLASQKQYMALYLVSVYSDPELDRWFRAAFAAAGKPLDMGKSCVRFKSLDALPLDVIASTIARVTPDAFLARYEAVRATTTRPSAARAVRASAKRPSRAAARLSGKRTKPARPAPARPSGKRTKPTKPSGKRTKSPSSARS